MRCSDWNSCWHVIDGINWHVQFIFVHSIKVNKIKPVLGQNVCSLKDTIYEKVPHKDCCFKEWFHLVMKIERSKLFQIIAYKIIFKCLHNMAICPLPKVKPLVFFDIYICDKSYYLRILPQMLLWATGRDSYYPINNGFFLVLMLQNFFKGFLY